jgi:hypothetical protein
MTPPLKTNLSVEAVASKLLLPETSNALSTVIPSTSWTVSTLNASDPYVRVDYVRGSGAREATLRRSSTRVSPDRTSTPSAAATPLVGAKLLLLGGCFASFAGGPGLAAALATAFLETAVTAKVFHVATRSAVSAIRLDATSTKTRGATRNAAFFGHVIACVDETY